MSSHKYHWNSMCRFCMIAAILVMTIWLIILGLLPKESAWGLSAFKTGSIVFHLSSQAVLTLATFMPLDMLVILAPSKKGEHLAIILPEKLKPLFLRELRNWGLLYLIYMSILLIGHAWMGQMITQYEMENFLVYSASKLILGTCFPLFITLQGMIGMMYTYAKQANGTRVFFIALGSNLIFILMWLSIIYPHNIEFNTSLPVLIAILVGVFINKQNWLNELYQ